MRQSMTTQGYRKASVPMAIGRWFITAATRLTRDPRVRAKAVELFHTEVKPRAAETWRQAKPKLEAAGKDLRDIARETDARNNPGLFAAKLKKRFIDGSGRR
jgi:hypothetical protein